MATTTTGIVVRPMRTGRLQIFGVLFRFCLRRVESKCKCFSALPRTGSVVSMFRRSKGAAVAPDRRFAGMTVHL